MAWGSMFGNIGSLLFGSGTKGAAVAGIAGGLWDAIRSSKSNKDAQKMWDYYMANADKQFGLAGAQLGLSEKALALSEMEIKAMIEGMEKQFELQEKYLELQEVQVENMLAEGKIDRTDAYRMRQNLVAASKQLSRNMTRAWKNLGPAFKASPEQMSRDYGMLRRLGQRDTDRALDRIVSKGHAANISRRPGMRTFADDANAALLEQARRDYDQVDVAAWDKALSRTSSMTQLLNAHRDPYLNEVERISKYPVQTAKNELEVNIPKTGFGNAATQFSSMVSNVPNYGLPHQYAASQYGTNAGQYGSIAGQYGNIGQNYIKQGTPYMDYMNALGTGMGTLMAQTAYGNPYGGSFGSSVGKTDDSGSGGLLSGSSWVPSWLMTRMG